MKPARSKRDSLYLGFDVGGTNIRAAAVDTSGEIKHLLEERINDSSPESIFTQISQLTYRLIELFPKEKIEAAGFGIPGFIDFNTFILTKSPNLPILNGINLKEQLNQKLDLPFFIENDANAAAFAEKVLGWGKEVENLIFITIGTGLGSGLILKGEIWHGVSGFGGELGHTSIDQDGIKCGCGNFGCLETIVSGTGIAYQARNYIKQGHATSLSNYDMEQIDSKLVHKEAIKGDELAVRVLEETGEALGLALANVINLLNIYLIVLGGKVMKASDFILPSTMKAIKKRALKVSFDLVAIKISRLGEYAGLIGAALLAANGMESITQ